MKNILILIIALTFSLLSCGKEEPDFVGTYNINSGRTVCDDTSKNNTRAVGTDGLCVTEENIESCVELELILLADLSFSFTLKETRTAGTIVFSSAPTVDSGTYTTIGNTVTLNLNSPVSMELSDDETSLDWSLGPDNNGCEVFYSFRKN